MARWFHGDDLSVMDSDGYLNVVDRKKDMIKTYRLAKYKEGIVLEIRRIILKRLLV